MEKKILLLYIPIKYHIILYIIHEEKKIANKIKETVIVNGNSNTSMDSMTKNISARGGTMKLIDLLCIVNAKI